MELISRDEAMRLLKEDLDASRSREDDERAEACLLHFIEISNLPTVEERNEGEWINKYKNDSYLECSVCQYPIIGRLYQKNWLIVPYNYCPNCGAKMKGE